MGKGRHIYVAPMTNISLYFFVHNGSHLSLNTYTVYIIYGAKIKHEHIYILTSSDKAKFAFLMSLDDVIQYEDTVIFSYFGAY